MCPACIATAAPVVAGATSTGGLLALAVKKRPPEDRREKCGSDEPYWRKAR